MSSAFLSILKKVPWNEVITRGPQLAEAASGLYDSVRARFAGAREAPVEATAEAPADPAAPLDVEALLAPLRARVETLEAELVKSSRVIAELGQQNTALIAQLEQQARWLRWTAWAAGTGLAAAIAALIWMAMA
jgi:hypothetical protein